MVKPFEFARLPKILFKNGAISNLPEIILPFGKRIVVVTGKDSFINSLSGKKLIHDIDEAGIIYHIITISGEPSPDNIDRAVKDHLNEEINMIIGIGGGSVLDAGKAISAMMHRSESIVNYLEGIGTKSHPGTKIPYVAIPTTSGTGSEATKNAVISQVGEYGFKRSFRHDNFVPDIALVDPHLTLNCPQPITAASGMDCFTQLIEAYLSDKACEFTDALAFEGLKQIKASLIESYINGDNAEARSGMSFASLTSGICLANAGLGVVHGFASSIGGMYNIPHGIICGTLMASSNELTVRVLRKSSHNPAALKKYAIMGRLFLKEKILSDDYYIDGFISYLHNLTQDLNLPGLRNYGLGEKEIGIICLKTENKNNPVKLTVENMEEILKKRL